MKVLLVVDLTSKGFYTSGKELGSMKGELGCAKALACDDEVDEVWKEGLWWIRGYIRRNAFILTI